MLTGIPDSSTLNPAEDQSVAPSSLAGGKRKGKQPTEGTSRQKRGKGAGSATGTPELWAPQFTSVELGKHVTFADTSKDHETCVALGNAMMLPQDVADHAAESAAEFGGKLVMLGAQVSAFVLLVSPHLVIGSNRVCFSFSLFCSSVISAGCVHFPPAEARRGRPEESEPEGAQP